MTIDGEKLRDIRTAKGITQEKLAAMSNLKSRTIQRAEAGHPVAPETLAFIAEALEVEPVRLRGRQGDLFEPDEGTPPEPQREGEVILVPCNSGRRLVEKLRSLEFAALEYDVEPTEETLDAIKALGRIYEKAFTDVFVPRMDRDEPISDVEALDLQVFANKALAEAASLGLRVFMGLYHARVPDWRMDEFGNFYSPYDSPEKFELKAMVVISDAEAGHLSRMPRDYWGDEIPF